MSIVFDDPYHGQGGSYVVVDGKRLPAGPDGQPLPSPPESPDGGAEDDYPTQSEE